MQPLSWYYRRLRGMSPAEVAWRARSAVRNGVDRWRVASGRFGPGTRPWSASDIAALPLCDIAPGSWLMAPAGSAERAWAERLRDKADRIVEGRLSFFQLTDVDLGDPIDWNRDHECGRRSPLAFSGSIDYRDHAAVGDCKLVWEPNRHHQMVVLARAYRATGDVRYAAAVVALLGSWLEQSPVGRGMNWRSPLELAIRAINWVWAIQLIRSSAVLDPPFVSRLLSTLEAHVWDIGRKYSRGSSANNHLIGEAAGVFTAASYCPGIRDAARHLERSRQILIDEIAAQTYRDGGPREQAFAYHLFTTQFFLFAGIVGRASGRDFPRAYWARLEKMFEFLAAMTEGGPLPMIGDADDGYVLDLDGAPGDPRGLLGIAAILFERADFKRASGAYGEAAAWLFGGDGRRKFEGIDTSAAAPSLGPRAFSESGYYVLQHGHQGSSDAISVLFDCGELGYGSLAAHGHADALSFSVRACGGDVLVDPGTYDYFTYPEWREYFRSTRAHNTIVVDDADQSETLGPFLWGARANATCVAWDPAADRQRVGGEHDGYARLPDPVVHRRTLELDASRKTITVVDDLSMTASHRIAMYLHFDERWELVGREGRRFVFENGNGRVTLALDPALEPSAARGSEGPIGGWVSRGYHRKTQAWTVSAAARLTGPTRLITSIEIATTVGRRAADAAGRTFSRTGA